MLEFEASEMSRRLKKLTAKALTSFTFYHFSRLYFLQSSYFSWLVYPNFLSFSFSSRSRRPNFIILQEALLSPQAQWNSELETKLRVPNWLRKDKEQFPKWANFVQGQVRNRVSTEVKSESFRKEQDRHRMFWGIHHFTPKQYQFRSGRNYLRIIDVTFLHQIKSTLRLIFENNVDGMKEH